MPVSTMNTTSPTIGRRRSRRRSPNLREHHTNTSLCFLSHASLQASLQWAIVLAATLFFIMAHDHHNRHSAGRTTPAVRFLQHTSKEPPDHPERIAGSSRPGSSSRRRTEKVETMPQNDFWSLSTPSLDFLGRGEHPSADDRDRQASAKLETFLNASTVINEAGKALVRSYQHYDYSRNNNNTTIMETQPLRHLQFDHLDLPPVPPKTPVMSTAHLQSTVVQQAPWFPHYKLCNDTCCAQKVAISLQQDEHRIINAVDGADLADVLLFGHTPAPFHKFFASELTDAIVPCLQPGVIIHADSYRGPITRFFHDHRPRITVPYVLLTTKTDGDTPITFFRDRLDTDPLLQAWYGINPNYALGANHSKFRMMPLGLTGNKFRQHPDLDLLLQARNYTNPFGGSKQKWYNSSVWEKAVDTSSLLFVKFGVHENALHREIPWNMACQNRTRPALEDMSCNKEKGGSPRQTYAAASKYLFGLSPPGNGVDCFRTYEYLLNGIIPVVQAQPEYDELFEDLPVLQIQGWNYSQQELVTLMHNYVMSPTFRNCTFDRGWNRLFLQHWRQKVLQDAGRLDEIVTDPTTGQEYYTAWQYSLYKKPLIEHAIPEQIEIRKRKQEQKEREKAKKLLEQVEALHLQQKQQEKQQQQQQEQHRITGEVQRPQAQRMRQQDERYETNSQDDQPVQHRRKHRRHRHHHN